MKRKIFIFLGIITLVLSLFVVKPKPKAKVMELYTDYDLIVTVVYEEYDLIQFIYLFNEEEGNIDEFSYYVNEIMVGTEAIQQPLSYYYEGQRFKLLYQDDDTLVISEEVSEIRNLAYYNTIKEGGDKLVYLSSTDTEYYFFLLKTREMFIFNKNEINIQPYWDLHPALQVPVPLKSGTIYDYREAFNDFYPMTAEAIAYQLGYYDAYQNYDSEVTEAYQRGYDNALIYLEDYRETAIQEGYSQAYNEYFPQIQEQYWKGYNLGRSQGFDNGYQAAIDNFDEEGIYQTGYNDGYAEGVKDEVAKNSKNFYDGIANWLVPAIIVILVFSVVITFKRRNSDIE